MESAHCRTVVLSVMAHRGVECFVEIDFERSRIMQKSFSFKGINRSTDVALAQDGECLDIVNMRMSGGSLVPMPKPTEVTVLDGGYSALYWHEIAECYIGITDDGTPLHFYDKEHRPIMKKCWPSKACVMSRGWSLLAMSSVA